MLFGKSLARIDYTPFLFRQFSQRVGRAVQVDMNVTPPRSPVVQ